MSQRSLSICTSCGVARRKQAGIILCRALRRGSQLPTSPARVKIEKINSSLLEEIGVQHYVRWVVIFTFQRILSPQVVHFLPIFFSNCHLSGSLTLFVFSELWGLVKDLEERPLFQVETALVNASTCQDLLLSTNLVSSGLVDVAVGMDNKIFSAMSRKRGWAPSSFSNPPPPPKKTSIGPSKALVPALPPPPPRKCSGERTSAKSPEVSIHSGDRSSLLPPRDQGDYLTSY